MSKETAIHYIAKIGRFRLRFDGAEYMLPDLKAVKTKFFALTEHLIGTPAAAYAWNDLTDEIWVKLEESEIDWRPDTEIRLFEWRAALHALKHKNNIDLDEHLSKAYPE